MFGIMLQKMWHKKWMNLCLLLGCILLVATVVSFPLYKNAAYNRLLQDEFATYVSNHGTWPTMNQMKILSNKDTGGGTITKMENMIYDLPNQLGATAKESVLYYFLSSVYYASEMNRPGATSVPIHLGALSDVESHIDFISGEFDGTLGVTADGAIEVIVSQSGMIEMGVLVGETLKAELFKDFDGNLVRIYIKGVYEPVDESDPYWQYRAEDMTDTVLMNFDLFHSMFTGEHAGKYSITCNYSSLFEYENLLDSDAEKVLNATKYYTTESSFKSVMDTPDYMSVLNSYLNKKSRISATLVILQIPVLAMLAAFLLMISGQMYQMERNEISVIKSRGSSGGQIFRLYLYQGMIITVVGAAAGLPLGALFSRILGATRNFLEFDLSQNLQVEYTGETFIYALAAMAVTLLSITIPAIGYSKVSIVNLKQQKALKKKRLWEILFLDVILIGVSMYGFYTFNKQMDDISKSVMSGESLDPLLYISSSLFILGMGLLFLRIQPLLVKVIYTIGKRFWRPASHVSFMEIIKNGRKQQLIMLFLIMTISLGMYHATVARTILENAKQNTSYIDGTDVVVKEVWTMMMDRQLKYTGEYIEPDYSKYEAMDFAEHYTRVITDDKAYFTYDKTKRQDVSLMGIHTKQFGEITMVESSLMGKHYYNYLNALAPVEKGVLLSDNFRSEYGYKVGDSITYYNGTDKAISGTVVGFFSYWPGYSPSETSLNTDGTATTIDKYLIVANYDYLHSKLGTVPYEVWIGLKDGVTASDVYAWFTERNVKLTKYVNRSMDEQATMEDPLLQGTNGVLTMGFVVTILLCAVGYLIYWIMSIRERELMFGVLRACGLHKSEIIQMLINEQIFCGVLSIGAGIGIGKLTSKLFVPILQQAYASTEQVLPMKLITNASDMYRLYGVIGAVMVISLVVLFILVLRMNVTKALKLGEE